ncbi:MAG: hypothetical protein IPH28_19510 [Cytophagaceae bacterium]|nr:hypothetical protein [Cytophagaceae bacterium]
MLLFGVSNQSGVFFEQNQEDDTEINLPKVMVSVPKGNLKELSTEI